MNLKNVTYEEVKELFLSPQYSQIVSPYMIKRVQKSDSRFYVTINQDDPTFYLSVTSFASRSLSNHHLAQWRGKLGNDLADQTAHLSAHYGTFLHIELADYLMNGIYDFNDLDERVLDYLLRHQLSLLLLSEWIDKAHNDILSFAQWIIDKKVEVVGIEFPVVSDIYRLGGCIDLICELEFNKKRVKAIVDFKSGRKGFYESHELQLKTYREIWNELYSSVFEVTHVFNWAPKGWRKNPTYSFKNQTTSDIAHDLLMRRSVAENWHKCDASIKRGKGIIKLGQTIDENISVIDLKDFVIGRNKQKQSK